MCHWCAHGNLNYRYQWEYRVSRKKLSGTKSWGANVEWLSRERWSYKRIWEEITRAIGGKQKYRVSGKAMKRFIKCSDSPLSKNEQ